MAKIVGICDLHDAPHLGKLTEKRPIGTVSFLGRYADAPQLYVGAEQGAHVHSGVSAEYPPPDAECR